MANVTPLSPYPFWSFNLTLPDEATIVEADPGLYNNTKEVIVYNTNDANAVYMRILDLGSSNVTPADPTLVQLGNSVIIPALSSVSLCLGPEGDRHQVQPSSWWAAAGNGPGSKFTLAFRAAAGEGLVVNVTYVQTVGGHGARG